MQHHGLLLLIGPAQADIGNMKGGKFFHRCKALSVQRNLTVSHAGNIPGKITRFRRSKRKTWLQTSILPLFPHGNTHQFSQDPATPRFTIPQVKGNKKNREHGPVFHTES
ncbi:hypothetical protein [Janthinobacterium lividum]|uniref:hypothetical protein n=1 Tax=Janthinobacterium lividum TaxID=29581 RepID=UPI001408B5B4|nr:hypothetical protein [Janthinobacterium lividum]NHQ94203.1 hypothetical protein [Janthinobacterium lividum]